MSVNNVSMADLMCLCSAVDYEGELIARRLRAYGVEPTGDKQANKNKLHEIELRIAKSRNEPLGGLLTISYEQEKNIINNKKEKLNGTQKDAKKQKNPDVLKEDEIFGRQILAIIELKKREESDRKNTQRINSNKITSKKTKKTNKNKDKISYTNTSEQKYTPLPGVKSDTQEINTVKDNKN
ncbi:hypothetical protein IJ596_07040 [bacterium]|nr:hypothetical protein [bacterium]